MGLSIALILVLILVIGAEFVNGATDAPNSIATVVSTRVLSPRAAVLMATVLNGVGVLAGTAVAATIGKGFVVADQITLLTIASAMTAIIFWSSLAWYFGLPTSESHALVASLTGSALASGGFDALLGDGWIKVLKGLFFSTFVGFGAGLLIITAVYWSFRRAHPTKVRSIFGRLQVLSAGFMAFSHGSNDGQKFMGVFTLALMAAGALPYAEKGFHVPYWVIGVCSIAMALGTAIGGWRIIKTMGMRMVKLEPPQGFAAETGAATAILIASHYGIPLSTTHTISTSIMGVGSAKRFSAVRWGVVFEVVSAWILTFPVCFLIGFGITWLFGLFA
jgi:PiT family inorganic phosphate transporter